VNTTLFLSSVSFVVGGLLLAAHVLAGRREPLAVRLARVEGRLGSVGARSTTTLQLPAWLIGVREGYERDLRRAGGEKTMGRFLGEKTLLMLRTSDRPEDRKVLLKLYQEALEKDHAWREQAVLTLLEYKAHWGPTFKARRKLGKAVPSVLPDPDDIFIDSPTEFRFVGPVTTEEAEHWKLCKGFRSACVSVANDIVERAGLFGPMEDDRTAYEKLRRKYYRLNREVPPALKKKYPVRFPAFKPPAEPPNWYSETDEWRDPETGEWVVSDPLPNDS